jgi:hypothetical protein
MVDSITPAELKDVRELRAHLTHATDCIMAMPDHALVVLYRHFCSIQAATWLVIDKETADRFEAWFDSGKDEDAWS